jgi:hypothetical protein
MYKPFYRCWWAFLHIKYCSWCAADFGIEDLLLSEPTSSLQKQKTPQTPHLSLVLSFSLWQIVLGGGVSSMMTMLFGFLSSRRMHDSHNPFISIWQSQPKYIHLTVTTQIYSFGHSTEFSILFVGLRVCPKIPPQKERVSLFLFMVCVCVCVLFKFWNFSTFKIF